MEHPGGIEPLGSVMIVYANDLEDRFMDRAHNITE
jgi:hypothetical protein